MWKKTAILLITALSIQACSSVPITGRKQLNLLPESEMMSMSLSAYGDFLKQNPPLPPTDARVKQVRGIGEKISVSVEKYLSDNNSSDRIEGFNWEFNVVDDQTVNAWCMSGGKVVFYTGILPLCQDDAGIAVVMGHEIAHAIARHGNERMSQGVLAQGVGMTLQALSSQNPTLTSNLLLQSYGVGSQLGMLAYGRNQESEADKMGLIFMAMAGYDPHVAPRFWERMSAQGGQKPPELLSTHPSDERRMQDLEAYMPEAMKYYKP